MTRVSALLKKEMRANPDAQLRRAARGGIEALAKQLSWQYLEGGQNGRAAAALVRAWLLTGTPGLLARSAYALVRRDLRPPTRGAAA